MNVVLYPSQKNDGDAPLMGNMMMLGTINFVHVTSLTSPFGMRRIGKKSHTNVECAPPNALVFNVLS
jgi:hypothetical protein